jgi:hypothetical protein
MQNRTSRIFVNFLKMRTSGIRTSRDRTSGGPPVHVFGKLTTPYVMFESKKLKFLLLIRRKELIEPKKVS